MLDSRFSMSRLLWLPILLASLSLVGCDQASRGDDDDSIADDDDDSTPDPDPVAPLAELSDGECPDMSESGISRFSSGG